MTDELRKRLEEMKATLESLLEPLSELPPRSSPRLCIARILRDSVIDRVVAGDVAVVLYPPDPENGLYYALTQINTRLWLYREEVDTICSLDDALAAWEEKENKDD